MQYIPLGRDSGEEVEEGAFRPAQGNEVAPTGTAG